MNARPAVVVLFTHAVQSDEVLLGVRGDLGWRARNDKVSADASPITLSELVQPEKEQSVFVFRPRNTFTAFLFARLGRRLGLFGSRSGRRGWRRGGCRRLSLDGLRRDKVESDFGRDVIRIIFKIRKGNQTRLDGSDIVFQSREAILQVLHAFLRHLLLKPAPVVIPHDWPRTVILRETRLKEFILLPGPTHGIASEKPEVCETGVDSAVPEVQSRHLVSVQNFNALAEQFARAMNT